MLKNLQSFIKLFPQLKVTLIGDAMLDIYLEGTSNRLCREAPVPIVEVERRTDQPGGAANTAVNLAGLGGQVNFLSVVGGDTEGAILQECLKAKGVSTAGLFVSRQRRTLSKQRIMAAGQMLVRFDQGSEGPVESKLEQALIERLSALYEQSDAIVISDYGYGVLTPRVIETIERLQARFRKVLVADAKDLTAYREVGLTAVKPNFQEALRLLKVSDWGGQARADFLAGQQEKLLELTGASLVAVTLDCEGALVFERGQPPYRTYACPNPNSRAAGAGDTFAGALTLALAARAETPAAAELASAAAAVVVNKEGTSSCSLEELKECFQSEQKFYASPARLAARLKSPRLAGKRVVFTNGCFDILHPGHINLLNRAKELGDILIVAVNADSTVEKLKGPGRPINPLMDRLKVLAALSCIDYLVPFEDLTPEKLIKTLRPAVVVKGSNYRREMMPEASLVEAQGGEIQFLPYLPESSTSGLFERIREVLEEIKQAEPLSAGLPGQGQ